MCASFNTIKKGSRRGVLRFRCASCSSWFSVNRKAKLNSFSLLKQHLDGTPFRKLASQNSISPMTAYRKCISALEDLPHCADITRKYCSKFSGILLVDGKYIKVKGFDRKIPVIYGIDYLTHDIPTYIFSVSENYQTLKKFFSSLRLLNYPLYSLVSDDNLNFPQTCFEVYPKASWQLCTNHFKENIRTSLEVRTDPKYKYFMRAIEDLFRYKISEDNFNRIAKNLLTKYIHDELCVKILLDIERRKPNLLGHLSFKNTPTTSNLIESFNSHLNIRLKSIKGFEDFHHANAWLNGYFINRRTTPFTGCSGKFRYLNGRCSLEETLRRNVDLPTFF